jgi:hypothetical protein
MRGCQGSAHLLHMAEPFRWVDQSVPGPGVAGHWGYTGTVKNPNNASGSDYCAVARWAMRYGTPSTWGYDDVGCSGTYISMCRLRSGWQSS